MEKYNHYEVEDNYMKKKTKTDIKTFENKRNRFSRNSIDIVNNDAYVLWNIIWSDKIINGFETKSFQILTIESRENGEDNTPSGIEKRLYHVLKDCFTVLKKVRGMHRFLLCFNIGHRCDVGW